MIATRSSPKPPPALPTFCRSCGERLPALKAHAIACPSCGGRFGDDPRGASNARTAGLLSLFLPGAGQVFNGQFLRGLCIFATSWLIVPWLFGVIDAYGTARRAELAQAS